MKKLLRFVARLLFIVFITAGSRHLIASSTLKPWASNTHPTDEAKSHVEEVTDGPHRYTILQGGTMDGRNCRLPMGCGINREGAFLQTWESNRSVRMENVGDTDVINPWLSNGRNDFRTVRKIVASAVTPEMTDAEKAYALWFQEIQYRHHSPGDNNELGDPVKIFNVYGYNTCGNDSISMAALWHTAGMKVAPARALGHCISQAFFDGNWHFYDGDMHSVYLLRDNKTVAGEQDIVRDHDLIKRTHSKGILMPDTWWDGQGMCAMYFYQGKVTGERNGQTDTTMNITLRPGEALVWRWGQLDPVKYHGALQTMPTYESAICNGLWEYRPDFSKETWRKGATVVENITSFPLEGVSQRRTCASSSSDTQRPKAEEKQNLNLAGAIAAEEGKKGTIIWTMRAPYVFVGGHLEADSDGARFFVSADGKAWQGVTANFDKFFSTVGPAHYEYKLKCELQGAAQLRHLAIINDLQMAPLALPEMGVGQNAFTYTDQSRGERNVRITHEWVERSASRPPSPSLTPIYPPDGGEADGTDVAFQWSPSNDSDDDAIADYQFELSNRADMRWPLSMNFYKLISKTPDGAKEKGNDRHGKASIDSRYTLSQPGLLAPDQKYYWHVRALDSKGVWGSWSKTWSFIPRGPAYPVNVTLDYDSAKGTGVLHWAPNPVGRSPVKFRIYGSDEKGFTIADKPYQGTVGVTKQEMAAWNPWFPANFIAEVTGTELAVLGPGVTLPGANKTFYRVVAVDEHGKLSGPSDYAAGPRPSIYTKPVVTAKVGAEYRYTVRATRSVGDLSARMKGDQQVSGYFDIETPKFAIERGPAWLKVDENTGLLSGMPVVAGEVEVVLRARIDREVRNLDEPTLKWGNEKVLSVNTEEIGISSQKFVINVLPATQNGARQ